MAEPLGTNFWLEGAIELGWNRFLGITISALDGLPTDFFHVIKK